MDTDILKKAAWLKNLLLDRLQLIAHNKTEMARLDLAGRIYATAHYREGKYLYLIYPKTKDEVRVRQYIGADPKRVEEALAKIQNAKKYEELADQTRQIEAELRLDSYQIGEICRRIERLAPLDLVTESVRAGEDPSLDGDKALEPGAGLVTTSINRNVSAEVPLKQMPLSTW